MIRVLVLWLALAGSAFAQDFSGLARVDPVNSSIRSTSGEVEIALSLSQAVPYRVFTLDAPRRLVIDFREVDWAGLEAVDILATSKVSDVRFGGFRPGWSRMVADLAEPLILDKAGLVVDTVSGNAKLTMRLTPATPEDFAASAGAFGDDDWDSVTVRLPSPPPQDEDAIVVIDPGHGGIDPGAQRGGINEADLMLSLGIELADRLNRGGNVRAILTRDADYFVPLHHRITIARAAKADLMISLHADALEKDEARGGSVYTLSEAGEDSAAQRMAERHERGDLLAGVDLSGQGDRVATVLMDLARAQTSPASDRFAQALVDAFKESGARLNSRPRREGRLAVLTAADFSSVLVEVGFLSSQSDRQRLQTPEGRAAVVAGLANATERWILDEAARKTLNRQ